MVMVRAWIETEVAEEAEGTEAIGLLPPDFHLSVYLRLLRSLRFLEKPDKGTLA